MFHGGLSARRELPMLVELWRTGRLPIERLISSTADLKGAQRRRHRPTRRHRVDRTIPTMDN